MASRSSSSRSRSSSSSSSRRRRRRRRPPAYQPPLLPTLLRARSFYSVFIVIGGPLYHCGWVIGSMVGGAFGPQLVGPLVLNWWAFGLPLLGLGRS